MPNDFDRIFKEDCLPFLIQKITGLDYSQTVALKDKIQITTTSEREADDFRIVLLGHDLLDHGLQFEVHVADEDLRARNQLHHAMFIHKYGMNLRQIVVYVGDKIKPAEITKNELPTWGRNFFEFEVYVLRTMPAADFLSSSHPGEVILGILADFGGRQSVEIIREILQNLLNLTGQTLEFEKYKRQLAILSKLRKLQAQTKKEIKAMPTQLFSIEDDIYFQEGEERGMLKGELKGELKGKLEGMSVKTLDFITNLITLSDHEDAFIARLAGVKAESVTKIREIMLEHPMDFRSRLDAMDLHLIEQTGENL